MSNNLKSSTTKANVIYTAPETGLAYEPHTYRNGSFRMGLPIAQAGGMNFRARKMVTNEIEVKTEKELLAKLATGHSVRMIPIKGQRTRDDQPVRRKARMTPAQSISVGDKQVWEKVANGEVDLVMSKLGAQKKAATKKALLAEKRAAKKSSEAIVGTGAFTIKKELKAA